jgi:hypothetical protein
MMGLAKFLCVLPLVAAYDDASLMQQNMGVEAAATTREKYVEMVNAIQEGRKQFPSMGKLRELALDGLMSDLSSEAPAYADNIFAQIHELLQSIDIELQEQNNVDQAIIDAHEPIITACNTQNEGPDDTAANDFETASENHRYCREGTGGEDSKRTTAETDCGAMTQEMSNRRQGSDIFYGESAGSGSLYNDGTDYSVSEMDIDCAMFGTAMTDLTDSANLKDSRPNSGETSSQNSIMKHTEILSKIVNGNTAGTANYDWYSGLTKIMYWYNAVERLLGPLLAPCEVALHAYAAKRVECHGLQVEQEQKFCTHKNSRLSTCSARDSCWTSAKAAYDSDWATYLPIANQRFHEGSMVRYVRCLIVELQANNTAITPCQTDFATTEFQTNATDSFNITVASVDAKSSCNTTYVDATYFPADAIWQTRHLDAFSAQNTRTPYNDDLTASHCCASSMPDRAGCCTRLSATTSGSVTC